MGSALLPAIHFLIYFLPVQTHKTYLSKNHLLFYLFITSVHSDLKVTFSLLPIFQYIIYLLEPLISLSFFIQIDEDNNQSFSSNFKSLLI